MPINKSVAIKNSVGSRATNNLSDVCIVQQRLNELMPSSRIKLNENGQMGLATLAAIFEFQKVVCGFKSPDTRVDPDKTTIRMLNDPNSKKKWADDPLATASSEFETDFAKFATWLKSRPSQKPSQNAQYSQQITLLKAELKNLEETIKQKYPDGRPTGIGVLAVYTPGDVTISGLKKLTTNITEVQRKHGTAAGCLTAIVSTAAIPFIIYGGGVVDFFVTVGELAMGNPKHGDPKEYERTMNQIRAIRQKISLSGS